MAWDVLLDWQALQLVGWQTANRRKASRKTNSMKFNKDQWEASYKKAASDLSGNGPSDGIVCILASLRYIANGLCDDIGQGDADAKAQCETIRDGIKELYESCNTAKTLSGFASNASSAAKACELGNVAKAKAMAEF
jgi:hypothetical protein